MYLVGTEKNNLISNYLTACKKPNVLKNGVFNEVLVENYVEGETIPFTCNDLFGAKPQNPVLSDIRSGLISCRRDGWIKSPVCQPGKRNC